jgi:hypothetical protein
MNINKGFREKTPIISCTVDEQREILYTCPSNCRARVPLVYIVNANGTVSIVFELYKAATDTHFFIIAGKNLGTGESLQLSDGYIVLEPGDKLEVTPTGSTPIVDALCTVEEIFIPVG